MNSWDFRINLGTLLAPNLGCQRQHIGTWQPLSAIQLLELNPSCEGSGYGGYVSGGSVGNVGKIILGWYGDNRWISNSVVRKDFPWLPCICIAILFPYSTRSDCKQHLRATHICIMHLLNELCSTDRNELVDSTPKTACSRKLVWKTQIGRQSFRFGMAQSGCFLVLTGVTKKRCFRVTARDLTPPLGLMPQYLYIYILYAHRPS